jgi:DNA-binding NarL/FixJ family response regulator
VESGRQILQRILCGAVVLLTVYNDRQLRDRAFAEGIRGYVLKVDAGEELIRAVRAVLAGDTYVSQGAVQKDR